MRWRNFVKPRAAPLVQPKVRRARIVFHQAKDNPLYDKPSEPSSPIKPSTEAARAVWEDLKKREDINKVENERYSGSVEVPTTAVPSAGGAVLTTQRVSVFSGRGLPDERRPNYIHFHAAKDNLKSLIYAKSSILPKPPEQAAREVEENLQNGRDTEDQEGSFSWRPDTTTNSGSLSNGEVRKVQRVSAFADQSLLNKVKSNDIETISRKDGVLNEPDKPRTRRDVLKAKAQARKVTGVKNLPLNESTPSPRKPTRIRTVAVPLPPHLRRRRKGSFERALARAQRDPYDQKKFCWPDYSDTEQLKVRYCDPPEFPRRRPRRKVVLRNRPQRSRFNSKRLPGAVNDLTSELLGNASSASASQYTPYALEREEQQAEIP